MRIVSGIKLRFFGIATCQYSIDGHHIILKGASGNGKTYLACALGNAACRKFYIVKCIHMLELLDELNVAKGCGDFKKTIKAYQKIDLLILDEWLIRTLTLQESYDLLEIAESRFTDKSTIFCTQYEPVEWYSRIAPTEAAGRSMLEVLMSRIIYNSYEVLIDDKVSMCEQHGLKAT